MGNGVSIEVTVVEDVHSLDVKGIPNSRTDFYKDGKLVQQRWYGKNGFAIRNRDFTNHGNSKEHPVVPHDHIWDWSQKKQRQDDIAPDPDWF